MKKCDIIIPIYNAYDYVEKCIQSILKYTDLNENRLILIDDKSQDEKILPMIKKYAKENKGIIVLENKDNLGFVKTVNKGMKYSKSDVLLLNSDTEVSPNWLEKIKKTAYSREKVATVTPLSNNATLVSVPNGLSRNEIPEGLTFLEFAELIEKCAYHHYDELPTSHGFCMYIRREVIEEIGYFNEEVYGKGYGEENDFSYRALDYGYCHLLCDDTLIYHKESQSFSKSRDALKKEHAKLLEKDYPFYTKKTELWCNSFPIRPLLKDINYHLDMHKRKNILFIHHNFMDKTGGTTIHIMDLIKYLKKDYNIHVLSVENGIYKLYSFFEKKEEILTLKSISTTSQFPRYSKEYQMMLEQIILAFGIKYIHVHHLINHFLDIATIIKKYNLKSSITLHDYYLVCPTINMLYKMESYCMLQKDKDCGACLKYKLGIHNNILDSWQKDIKKFLTVFSHVFVPDESVAQVVKQVYKDIAPIVIPHGSDLEKLPPKENNNSYFKIAFVGIMAPHKGSDKLKYLIEKSKNIEIHLFGTSEDNYFKKNRKNYIYHGPYQREELPHLLQEYNIDLVVMLSICPETFSYTLTETLCANIPVLSYDIGAVASRIKEADVGYVIPYLLEDEKILPKIEEILNNKEEYQQKKKNIERYHVKTALEMTMDYKKYYDKECDIKEISSEHLKELIEKEASIAYANSGNQELDRILGSLKWRLISKIRVPEPIRKIARKVIR